jgi:hypothetical protein
MKKSLSLALLLCLVLPGLAWASKIKDQVIDPYVEVRQDEQNACGSGTLIDIGGKQYVLTAGHVVADLLSTATESYKDASGVEKTKTVQKWKTAYLYKETAGGKALWEADVVWFSDVEENGGHDLALLLPRKDIGIKSAKLATCKLEEGQDAWYIGTPAGLHQSLEKTIVNQVDHMWGDNPYTMVNGNGWFGNSGGGMFVYDGKDYVLAGVVVRLASRTYRSPLMCQTPATIAKFIKDFEGNK